MSDDLETALAAAVGRRTYQPEGAPLALNDGDGLRDIILRALNDEDTNHARNQQSIAAMQQTLRTIEK